jgi:hypothetical protein
MNFNQLDWQTIVALMIVLAAIGVLARKMWNSVFAATSIGCGTSCSSCPVGSSNSANPIKATRLVQLDSSEPK